MPLVDKPVPELLKYQGRNPRPDDFDAYWAFALEELSTIDPEAELVPATDSPSRRAECFDLWFTSTNHSRIYAKYLRPQGSTLTGKKYPTVLRFHGYSANSGGWAEKLAWPLEGFCYAAMDCRGQGGRSHDGNAPKGTNLRGQIVRGLEDPDPRKLTARQLFLDTVQLARVVMNLAEVDAERMGTMGGSQGGGLALACAALEPRIRRVAAVHPFLCDYQRYWELDLAKDAFEELRYFFRQFDPLHEREAAIFTKLGYVDCQHLAPRIRGQVLMLTGLMDTVCPPSTQFAAFNKITSPKEVVIYPDYAHEQMPSDLDRMLQFMQTL